MSAEEKSPSVSIDQLRALENRHDNFAHCVSAALTEEWGAVVDVDCMYVDQNTYGEFLMALALPCCAYRCLMKPSNDWAILDFSKPMIFPFVDRKTEGEDPAERSEESRFAHIQAGVIDPIVKTVFAVLEATWEPVSRIEATDIQLETNPERMKVAQADDKVILFGFEVNATLFSGMMTLCYPSSVVPLL